MLVRNYSLNCWVKFGFFIVYNVARHFCYSQVGTSLLLELNNLVKVIQSVQRQILKRVFRTDLHWHPKPSCNCCSNLRSLWSSIVGKVICIHVHSEALLHQIPSSGDPNNPSSKNSNRLGFVWLRWKEEFIYNVFCATPPQTESSPSVTVVMVNSFSLNCLFFESNSFTSVRSNSACKWDQLFVLE